METIELVNLISKTLLWEIVANEIEKIESIPRILGKSSFKENIISEIEMSEILDSESFDIMNFNQIADKIQIEFEMLFILSLWSNNKQLYRITAVATGKCEVPDTQHIKWDNMKFNDMSKPDLLSYKELVNISELNFSNVECAYIGSNA